MERLREEHWRKLTESQLALDRERAKREADLQESKLKSEQEVKRLTAQQKAAVETAANASSESLKAGYELQLKAISEQLAKAKQEAERQIAIEKERTRMEAEARALEQMRAEAQRSKESIQVCVRDLECGVIGREGGVSCFGLVSDGVMGCDVNVM